MSAEHPPCLFVKRLGGLYPANSEASAALSGVTGKCVVRLTAASRNQRRRSLYWIVVGIVAAIMNDLHSIDMTDAELHDNARRRLGYVTYLDLPGGRVERLRSTSDKAMDEPTRAIYTNKAFDAFARWTGIPVETLIEEGRKLESA